MPREDQKNKNVIHNKENKICNIFPKLMAQQLLVNKHHRMRDSNPESQFGQVEVCVWSPTKKNTNKFRAEQEPRSAHGHAVKEYTDLYKPVAY